jgi:hypothetical protein
MFAFGMVYSRDLSSSAAALALLMTRINPLWLVAVGGALGGMGCLG